jgi:hypothetical protein
MSSARFFWIQTGAYPEGVLNLNLVTRIHVLTAIKVHDQMGATEFLAEQGLEGPGETLLVERGKKYDACALLAVAYARATDATTTAAEVADQAVQVLRRLDFTVTDASEPVAPVAKKRVAAPRKTAAVKAPAKADRVYPLCPKCFMQLPSTGVCNYCE